MGQTFKPDDISDILADMNRRLENLETGGKPLLKTSGLAKATFTLEAFEAVGTIAYTVTWSDSNVDAIIGAEPYFALYIDNDENPAYQWPSGVSLTEQTLNTNFVVFLDEAYSDANGYDVTRARFFIRNNDSAAAHTYYLYANSVYKSGNSGSSGSVS